MLPKDGSTAFVGGSSLPVGTNTRNRRAKVCRREMVQARARNPGGFQLPPHLPQQRELLMRANELLGNRAQRQLGSSAEMELFELIGTVPESKLDAQKFKAAIELRMRKEYRVENGVLLATPLTRTRYMDMITMPKSERDIQTCFGMLQALRRNGQLSPSSARQLESLIGMVPRDAHEARRASNALKRLVRERFRRERFPPRIPETDDELTTAYMLLGAYARQGTAWRRNSDLKRILGDLPRTKVIAEYWKKYIGMHIRKNKRSALVSSRRMMADLIREQRRKKREARLALEAAQKTQGETSSSLTKEDGERFHNLNVRYVVFLAVAIALSAIGGTSTLKAASSKIKWP